MKKFKINSLFHLFYGVLMSLPLLAIFSSVLVNVFNKDNTIYYDLKYEYAYNTNDVNSRDDLVIGNIYHFHLANVKPSVRADYTLNCTNVFNIYTDTSNLQYFSNGAFNDDFFYVFMFQNSEGQNRYLVRENSKIEGFKRSSLYGISVDEFMIDFDFIYYSTSDFFIPFISKCDNVPIVGATMNESKNYNDIFYNSIERCKDSAILNWCDNNFLYSPISYCSALFGLPNNSVVNFLMVYWCATTIIWLMFDILMLLPNLVHKVIDKGGIN